MRNRRGTTAHFHTCPIQSIVLTFGQLPQPYKINFKWLIDKGLLCRVSSDLDGSVDAHDQHQHNAHHLLSGFGFRVSSFVFQVSGFGFLASGFWFRISGFGFWVPGFGFQVFGFEFWVSGFGFRVSGFVLRVSGFGFRVLGFRFWVWGSGYSGLGSGFRI